LASERDTPEHRKARREFCAILTALNLRRFVFIDESFCQTGMRREYGWAPRGQRLISSRPFGRWKTLSLIGAIRLGRRPCLMTNNGPVNARIFRRFITRRLAPTLRRGDIVVMDNLNIHRAKVVHDAIRAVGATPLHLPTYCPELNPIEMLWADLKRSLRKMALNTAEQLAPAVRRLRAAVPLEKIASWFRFSLSHAQIK
jgi:transposase